MKSVKNEVIESFYSSEKIKKTVPFSGSYIIEIIRKYYPNGNIESELSVKTGRAHRVWKSYNGLGKLNQEMKFWNGWLLRKIKSNNPNFDSSPNNGG